MIKKFSISFLCFSILSIGAFANAKTIKKSDFTIRKDSSLLQKPDTTLNQQNVVFPNPFLVIPTRK